jgi:two-component system, cell cycle response regulator
MKQLSTTDELTQIANRRSFNQIFAREWNRLRRDSQSIAVILSDIDFFKQYNDYYGHQAGDRCLQQIAQVLADSVRRSGEFVARYGGEEFVLVVANTTPEQVKTLTDRLHAQLHHCALNHDRSTISPYVTMSMGIAIGIPTHDLSPEQALEYADAALYKAKSQGRNQSCVHIFS